MRFSWIRLGMVLALFGIGAFALGACERDPTGNGNGDGDGDQDDTVIEVVVREDGGARSGVTIRLFTAGSSTAQETRQTNGSGVASFDDLTAGDYEVEIVVPDDVELENGETARKDVTVAEGDTEEVTFDLVGDGEPPAALVEINAGNFRFTPANATIGVGTTVRWTNTDGMLHTVSPSGHSEWSSASLGSQGATFEHTFDTAGSFDYFCSPHQSDGMVGSITVQ